VKRLEESDILKQVEHLRLEASKNQDNERKSRLRQYFSTSSLATLMASMLDFRGKEIRILDPGAGIGSLFAACIQKIVQKRVRPESVYVTAYEVDKSLNIYLENTFDICNKVCKKVGIRFEKRLIEDDFIQDSARRFGLSSPIWDKFDYAILNPPYGKINLSSVHYRILKAINSETPNYYAAFVYLTVRLLRTEGEMVSITLRSFCNGLHFKSFRKRFLSSMCFKRIHVFNSRTESFRHDNVQQENIIICSTKRKSSLNSIVMSSSNSSDDHNLYRCLYILSVAHPSLSHTNAIRNRDPTLLYY
jgi:adenine-specific DNA-methyltransferase